MGGGVDRSFVPIGWCPNLPAIPAFLRVVGVIDRPPIVLAFSGLRWDFLIVVQGEGFINGNGLAIQVIVDHR